MRAIQSPVFWLLILVAATTFAVILWKRGKRAAWGFKDVVKNPDYWQGFARAQQQVELAVEVAQSWDDNEIALFTRNFVLEATSTGEAWQESRILRELGQRTHPAVLGLLRDPSQYDRLVNPTGTYFAPEAPFNRACDLLGDTPGHDTVDILAPFLNDPSEYIRRDAASTIAKTGAATITSLIRQALSDPEESVRSGALNGMKSALDRSALSEAVRDDLFPDVLELLRTERNVRDAANVLYGLHHERAKSYFLSPEVWTVESPVLHESLKVLADAKAPVARDDLKLLIASLDFEGIKYPRTNALKQALRLLGQQQLAEDREFIRNFTTHPNERVAEGAAAGLLCSSGLENFQDRMWEIEDRLGYEGLTEPQRLYTAVRRCDSEINNGGFGQYFMNASGDRWPDAVAGFEIMGFRERLAVVKEAIAKFGDAAPAMDQNVRQRQLSRLFKRNDAIFEPLETRYYKSSEMFEVFVARFVLENAESFR